MKWQLIMCLSVAATLASTQSDPALALDKGFTEPLKLMGGKFRSTEAGDMTGFFLSVALVVIAAIAFTRYYNRREARRIAAAMEKRSKRSRKPSFVQRAAALGFKATEMRNLRKIAQRISPKMPATLLTTESGRKYLKADMAKRIRRQEREIEMLRGMLRKLDEMNARTFRERETARVDAEVPIWLVEKVPDDDPAGDENHLINLEPVTGTLLNLGEGGAAVRVYAPLTAGDLVEFWSSDSQIWLSPIRSGVVEVERSEDEQKPTAHLHFLDPPLTEIRKAIQQIRSLENPDTVLSQA